MERYKEQFSPKAGPASRSRWKTIGIPVLCALILLFGINAHFKPFASRHLVPLTLVTFDSTQAAKAQELERYGVSTPMVKAYRASLTRQEYWDKYQLRYISDAEMMPFLRANDFVTGPSTLFTENIPDTAQSTMLASLKRCDELITGIRKPMKSDTLRDVNGRAVVIRQWGIEAFGPSDGFKPAEVYIIADPHKFTNVDDHMREYTLRHGEYKLAPIDPIAVLKVPGGWLELASW